MFRIIIFSKTDGRISTHFLYLFLNHLTDDVSYFLMVCTVLFTNGGGVLVVICLILCGFVNLTNCVEPREPLLSWYHVFITPIMFKTSLKARIDSAGVLSLIGAAWHILVKIPIATKAYWYPSFTSAERVKPARSICISCNGSFATYSLKPRHAFVCFDFWRFKCYSI